MKVVEAKVSFVLDGHNRSALVSYLDLTRIAVAYDDTSVLNPLIEAGGFGGMHPDARVGCDSLEVRCEVIEARLATIGISQLVLHDFEERWFVINFENSYGSFDEDSEPCGLTILPVQKYLVARHSEVMKYGDKGTQQMGLRVRAALGQ